MEELIFFIARYMTQALISQGGRYRDKVKATYLSNSLGRLRGREMVHWLWQTEEFIAGSAIHSWLLSLSGSLSYIAVTCVWHAKYMMSATAQEICLLSEDGPSLWMRACLCVCVYCMFQWLLEACCQNAATCASMSAGVQTLFLLLKDVVLKRNKWSLTHFSPSWLQTGALLMSCYWKVGVPS